MNLNVGSLKFPRDVYVKFVNALCTWLSGDEIIGFLCKTNAIRLPQLCFLNEAFPIRLPQLFLNNEDTSMRLPQWAASISLNKVVFEGFLGIFPHLALHYSLLVLHSPRLVPEACLSCLRQLKTLKLFKDMNNIDHLLII